MKTLLAVITSFLLAGCVSVSGPVVPIEWVRHDTQQEVDSVCQSDVGLVGMPSRFPRRPFVAPSPEVLGCYIKLANGICQIHTTKIQSRFGDSRRDVNRIDGRLFQTVGHEVAHCFIGDFHKEE